MAVFMTMNELWKRTALGLVFCLLLIHSCHGQDDQVNITTTPAVTNINTTAAVTDQPNTDNPSNRSTEITTPGSAPDVSHPTTPAPSSDNTTDAIGISETTAQPVQLKVSAANPSSVFIAGKTESRQEEETISGLNKSLTSEEPEVTNENASGSSAVFVSVLVTGLLLAAMIIGAYYFKQHRKTNGKGGMKLTEESYMADEENQGNTLVSVAPLNQPEPQEKPSLNGESPEGVITQTPPAATNGHSTTKTADTEL
ncbi:uncharacterized protein cd34 [Triplophysa rosa]|uniref:Sialomucin core protein 24 n=1 Tax=Triplophysa rosa TaxID=992332 RepID=A0A9W7WDZ1_TRIRA|nr:uncharacterized protein cd34 [Triplophysa rosa]KAI7794328.1 hypothetical protein IRJ41_014981 [Triplophysa rosa]